MRPSGPFALSDQPEAPAMDLETRRAPEVANPAAPSGPAGGHADLPRSTPPWQFDTRVVPPREATPADEVEQAARSYLGLQSRKGPAIADLDLDLWTGSLGGAAAAGIFRDLHRVAPDQATRLARGVATLPEPGETFLGFHLIEQLGRGAFGRVYLAQQGELADRPVALKVSAELAGESKTLAQLQHANIVPIFSVHRSGSLQAVCMPYYGMTTLRDVFEDLVLAEKAPASGRSLVENLSSRRSPSGVGRSSRPRALLRPQAGEPTPLTGVESLAPEPTAPADEVSAPGGLRSNNLRMIGAMPYDRAVLWLGSCLADGLAHAHERGIIHRDLKPANILLTDDGQPMILDFNLAEDSKASALESVASMGGTLPYMAPEHLAAFKGDEAKVGARSDIYSLGIILYELMARRHPFPPHEDSSPERIDRMIAERQGPPPKIQTFNPRVSPAAESIIRHCLEADPARRYQSARELREDLERHLADRPLRHAPEPSARERMAKFGRRNPRFGTCVAITAAALALALALGVAAARGRRLATLEASAAMAGFIEDAEASRAILSTKADDHAGRLAGLELGRKALARFQVLDDPAWMKGPAFFVLAEHERNRLRPMVGETLMLMADADARDAAELPAPPARAEAAREGLALGERAIPCFEGGGPPPSLLKQRAALMDVAGRPDEAKALRARAELSPMVAPRDFLMAATELTIKGEPARALPLAEEATRRDPASFWAWFTLGVCRDRTERPDLAVAAFDTCVALRPDSPDARFNRGVDLIRSGQPNRALADFEKAAELKPAWHEPYLNRGLARRDLGDFPGAARDLTLALDHGATETRVYFLRADARARSGDLDGSKLDREAGLARVPTDAASWIARAKQRMATDPPGALADFEKASELAPRSLQALHMRAHVLAVDLGRLADAGPILDRALELYPENVPARAFRGVLRAVLGRRDEALRDAEEARWRDGSAEISYQLAGLYATTSRQVPDDREEAFRLLHSALKRGYGFDLIDADHELDPIRNLPEFRRIVNSARLARAASNR